LIYAKVRPPLNRMRVACGAAISSMMGIADWSDGGGRAF
jgi:hypothetical protein